MTETISNANLERVTRIIVEMVNKDGKTVEIGGIQDISPNESRDVTPQFTLGVDAEEPRVLVPGIVRNKTLKCSKLAIWKENIITALGVADMQGENIMGTLAEQKTPFTIRVLKSKADNSEHIVTTYLDCLLSDYSSTQDIGRGDVTIIESATIAYRKSEISVS